MFARHFIDSLDFARKGKELRGEIPVAGMLRMKDVLAEPSGRVSYVLRGFLNKDGDPMLELALDGVCQLRCQRCLQAMQYPVKQVSHLLLENEKPEEELTEEGYDSIPPDNNLDVAALVEDEVLLNLPFAPKHEPGICQVAQEPAGQETDHPFAILRNLKSK